MVQPLIPGLVADRNPYVVFFVAQLTDPSAPSIRHCTPMTPSALLARYPNVLRFCLPEPRGAADPRETSFTFVLTDELGNRLYGHCVRTVTCDVYCFLSDFVWCNLFRDLVLRFRAGGEHQRDLDYLEAFRRSPVPRAGREFYISPSGGCPHAPVSPMRFVTPPVRPLDGYNPFVDAQPSFLVPLLSMTELFSLVAAVLCEMRIVVVGPTAQLVSAAVLSALSLVRPFEWQHVLIPVVPTELLGVIAAPTPFIVGVLESQLPDALLVESEHVLFVRLNGGGLYLTGDAAPTAGGDAFGPTATELAIPTLPWSDWPLCSLRVAFRRAASAKPPSVEADELVLNALMDHFVHCFGLGLAPDYSPPEFVRTMARRGGQATTLFFRAVTEGIMFDTFRRTYGPALAVAEQKAVLELGAVTASRPGPLPRCVASLHEPDPNSPVTSSGTSTTSFFRSSPSLQSFMSNSSDGPPRRPFLVSEYLPEEGGFAEAVLVHCPHLYPAASLLLQLEQQQREQDSSWVRSTLVRLTPPKASLRWVGHLCSYGGRRSAPAPGLSRQTSAAFSGAVAE